MSACAAVWRWKSTIELSDTRAAILLSQQTLDHASNTAGTMMITPSALGLCATALAGVALAHEHHSDAPADPAVPVDSILWIHIGVQGFTWTVLFPLTMVLGLLRHRLHVPLSILALLLTTAGYFLGHGHGGRSFPHTAHGTVASLLVVYLAAQAMMGVYLKLHLKLGAKWVRPWVLFAHGALGTTFPVFGWLQMVLGVITLQSWCRGGALGQCLAHHIMGSAFMGYCVILLVMLKAGGDWLQRRGRSQEYFDSWVIMLFGIVNTFTEHHGGPWSHKDLQHTLMGVAWWAGGAVGIWLSRGARRNIFPSCILVLTGWAMSGHAQALMLSTAIHALFGYALMAAGVARMIEVCFVCQDLPTGTLPPVSATIPTSDPDVPAELLASETSRRSGSGPAEWYPIRAFQYLPPYLLVASGILFMSATDEELHWADGRGVDHITWGLIDFSISLALFFWFNVLIDTYTSFGGRYGAASSSLQAASFGSGAFAESGRTGLRGLYSRLSSSVPRDRLPDNGHEMSPVAVKDTDSYDEDAQELEAGRHVLFDEDDQDSFEDGEKLVAGSGSSQQIH